VASTGPTSLHDYLYEVDRIGKSITGEVQLELTHFPVDAGLASVVAQEVAAAVGGGLLLPTGLTGVTCDVNSSSDTSVPEETFTDGFFPDYGSDFNSIEESGLEDPPVENPEDEPAPSSSLTSDGDIANPEAGDTLTAPVFCEGGAVTWYRKDASAPGGRVLVQAPESGASYTMTINDIDFSVYSETLCPDATTPVKSNEVGPVLASANSVEFSGFGDYSVVFENKTIETDIVYCPPESGVAFAASNSGWVGTGFITFNGVYALRATNVAPTTLTFACSGSNTTTTVITTKVEVKTSVNGGWLEYYNTTDATNGSRVQGTPPYFGTAKRYYRIKNILRGATSLYP
jgi:hypothetical protein